MTPSQLPATRAAGLDRLSAFVPSAGRIYAAGRNDDPGPGQPSAVSGLSPYVRHRLLTEAELVEAALREHDADAAAFIQEVFWRSYWKGWLELRPAVWTQYRIQAAQAWDDLAQDAALRRRAEAAMEGRTGIDCFDAWAGELRQTGTLHNHARMWFASIWCFTLKLPWVLGADFFLLHLLDGDPASNTLSWRWVLGSQTKGKHYVARAANIARFTGGRFDPAGALDEDPAPVVETDPPPPTTLPPTPPPPAGPVALLLHEDDLHAESLDLGLAEPRVVAGFAITNRRSVQGCAGAVTAWSREALADGVTRAGAWFGVPTMTLTWHEVTDWAVDSGCRTVLVPWAPVGWTADALAELDITLRARGLALHRVRRTWDSACWPRSTRGFFAFRKAIPQLIDTLLSGRT